MSDLKTVVWKEVRALLSNRGSVLLAYGILIVAFGALMLLDSVQEIAVGEVVRPLTTFCFLGMVLASSQTARSFAGEREAKTLASLLCTRLSDRSLFLGKTLSIVLLSSIMMAVAGALHLLAINLVSLVEIGGGWLFYQARPEFVPYMFLLPLAIVCLTSVVGVLISLKVQSIRGAYLLNLFSGIPAIAVAFSVLNLGPWGWGWHTVLLSTVGLFAVLVVVIALVAIKRFRRETLLVEV